MRFLIGVIFLLNFSNCFSQIRMALAMPEYNVVYFGYNNLLEVSTRTKVNPKFIELKCEGAELTHKENNLWNLRPLKANDSIELIMWNSKTQKVIDRFVYVVKNLPDPQLFVGATEDGGKISKAEMRLFARYTDSPLKAEFSIKEATVTIEGYSNVFVSTANKLGADYKQFLKNVSGGTKVTIKAVALGPDGLEHIIYGEYVY
ncbi:MAG: hypothetical protein ACO1N0_19700 [Fluviicola sp.]